MNSLLVKARHLSSGVTDAEEKDIRIDPIDVVTIGEYKDREYPSFRTVITLASNRETYALDVDNSTFSKALKDAVNREEEAG